MSPSNPCQAKLSPVLAPDGLVRAKGRLASLEELPEQTMMPIILPRKSVWTEVIIKHMHIVVLRHMGGVNHYLAALREKYWIIHGRDAVRTVLLSCVYCQKINQKPTHQQMAPLSSVCAGFDSSKATHPFEVTSVDAAGPFMTKFPRGHAHQTRYLLVFTCTTFQGVHLKLLSSLYSACRK